MKRKRPTQKEMILQYMHDFGWITPMDAIHQIGCTKLSTRISELIRKGYEIEKETVWYENWIGIRTHFTRYRLAVS